MAADKGSSKRNAPRTVAEATRFTSSTPHANTKSVKKPATSASTSAARGNATPKSPVESANPLSKNVAGSRAPVAGAAPRTETMDERVRRLRAAHLAARQHNVSRLDGVISTSRKFFDAAHKLTIASLITFSGIALVVTVYATADMAIYNRKRRNEFFALQKQFETDSLEAARLAYMTGKASEEQIALVEDATAEANKAGVSLPPLLSAPQTVDASGRRDLASSPTGLEGLSPVGGSQAETEEKKGGITGWLFGGLKKQEVREDDAEYLASSTRQQATSAAQSLQEKASAAFEQERENQRRGGPLDQLGTQTPAVAAAGETKKKGWLW